MSGPKDLTNLKIKDTFQRVLQVDVSGSTYILYDGTGSLIPSLDVTASYASAVSFGVKSGIVSGSAFSGSPLKYSHTFTTPYPDANYTVAVLGSTSPAAYVWTIESQTANGFTINANTSKVISGTIHWQTVSVGEF